MKNGKSLICCVLLLCLAASGLAACQSAAGPETVSAPAPLAAVIQGEPESAPAEPAGAQEQAAQPAPATGGETPESRAAAKGLPAPPDVDIHSWEYKVVNYYNSIADTPLENYASFEGQGFDSRALDSLTAFIQAARDEGYQLYAAVAYRNYEFLTTWYTNQVAALGSAAAAADEENTMLHGPGVNEHQGGLAVDFTTSQTYSAYYGDFRNDGFSETDTYAWLLEHCAEYGFILSYPEGKENYYGVGCVEGHFRYVGKEAAKYIMDNGLCLEEFVLLYDPDIIFAPKAEEQAG